MASDTGFGSDVDMFDDIAAEEVDEEAEAEAEAAVPVQIQHPPPVYGNIRTSIVSFSPLSPEALFSTPHHTTPHHTTFIPTLYPGYP
jgi:hypothetical protein